METYVQMRKQHIKLGHNYSTHNDISTNFYKAQELSE